MVQRIHRERTRIEQGITRLIFGAGILLLFLLTLSPSSSAAASRSQLLAYFAHASAFEKQPPLIQGEKLNEKEERMALRLGASINKIKSRGEERLKRQQQEENAFPIADVVVTTQQPESANVNSKQVRGGEEEHNPILREEGIAGDEVATFGTQQAEAEAELEQFFEHLDKHINQNGYGEEGEEERQQEQQKGQQHAAAVDDTNDGHPHNNKAERGGDILADRAEHMKAIVNHQNGEADTADTAEQAYGGRADHTPQELNGQPKRRGATITPAQRAEPTFEGFPLFAELEGGEGEDGLDRLKRIRRGGGKRGGRFNNGHRGGQRAMGAQNAEAFPSNASNNNSFSSFSDGSSSSSSSGSSSSFSGDIAPATSVVPPTTARATSPPTTTAVPTTTPAPTPPPYMGPCIECPANGLTPEEQLQLNKSNGIAHVIKYPLPTSGSGSSFSGSSSSSSSSSFSSGGDTTPTEWGYAAVKYCTPCRTSGGSTYIVKPAVEHELVATIVGAVMGLVVTGVYLFSLRRCCRKALRSSKGAKVKGGGLLTTDDVAAAGEGGGLDDAAGIGDRDAMESYAGNYQQQVMMMQMMGGMLGMMNNSNNNNGSPTGARSRVTPTSATARPLPSSAAPSNANRGGGSSGAPAAPPRD